MKSREFRAEEKRSREEDNAINEYLDGAREVSLMVRWEGRSDWLRWCRFDASEAAVASRSLNRVRMNHHIAEAKLVPAGSPDDALDAELKRHFGSDVSSGEVRDRVAGPDTKLVEVKSRHGVPFCAAMMCYGKVTDELELTAMTWR